MYYLAIFLTVVTVGYGLVVIVLSVAGIAVDFLKKGSCRHWLLHSVYLLNGIVNLSVGGALFWWLEPTSLSTYSTIAFVTIFSLVDRFMRRYFSKRLESN